LSDTAARYQPVVPTIPPDVRQAVGGFLDCYHILWEVEQWAQMRTPAPTRS